MDNPIRRARPEKTGIRAPLGDLEMAVMRHVWACPHDGCLAADVQTAVGRVRPLALTTILTTLDRLCKKNILRRERQGKAYRYWATVSEEQLQQRIVEGVLSSLLAQFPKAVAAYFAQGEDAGSGKLADLARRVEAMKVEAMKSEAVKSVPQDREGV